MKNHDGKPICGADTTPLDPRTWRRSRQVWHHSHCKRVVKAEGERCWQHPSSHGHHVPGITDDDPPAAR